METDDFDLDIEILEIFELNEQLRVKVRHCYGQDDIGLSLESKNLNPFTDKPLWMDSVYNLLKKKYSPKTKKPINTCQEYIGQTLSLKNLKSGVVCGFKKRLINTLSFTSEKADEIINKYPDSIQLRTDIMNNLDIGFDKKTKEKLIKYYGGTALGFDSDDRPEIIELKKQGILDELGNEIKKPTQTKKPIKTNE